MSWLDDHFENFVWPNMPDGTCNSNIQPLGYFSQEELTIIKNLWKSVKKQAGNKQILLAGRDVFIFEILARRENYPTIFMPEISRATVQHIKRFPLEVEDDFFLFDTGFVGSIPRGLGLRNFSLMSYALNSSMVGYWPNRRRTSNPDTKQVFPHLSFSRGLALKIEKTPKYWESGRMGTEDQIIQPFSHQEEFYRAAQLTLEIYKNSAPKFINKRQPIGSEVKLLW